MKEEYFDIQDSFLKKMKADYEDGLITNPVFKPYFRWKMYDAPISIFTRDMLYEIAAAAQRELEVLDEKHPEAYKQLGDLATLNDIWKPYAGYGDDKYLYSYLSAIDSETANLLLVV